MEGAISPAGEKHPGTITFHDTVEGRSWTRRADEVPRTIAWVESDGVWQPVTRIEIHGTAEQREIIKYSSDGAFLESTIEAPPPQRSSRKKSVPTPMPDSD